MKCIIVANGSISDYSFYKTILEGANYVICADGGARHLINMNIVPDVIIGDLDSISEEAREFFLKEKVKFLGIWLCSNLSGGDHKQAREMKGMKSIGVVNTILGKQSRYGI